MFETLLINKQKCWILIQSPPEELEPNSIIFACTRFYENGKFQAMGMDGKKDKLYQSIILDKNDNHRSNDWSFSVKDSTFKIGEGTSNQYKALSFSADTIVLKNAYNHICTVVNVSDIKTELNSHQ